jgi:site-specific DNA recombinase
VKKAAIYCRVSTQEQAQEGYSIPAQKDRMMNYCKAKDWHIADIYIDGGYSGASLERPGIQRLISDIDKIDIVLVYKLDRLSRSQKDTLYLIEDVFLANNVDFVSMNEAFDTSTPFGRAIIGVLSVFSQLERETIKERMGMGRMERAKAGYYHGGAHSPIGYDYVDGELIVNEYEAMQVRKIYQMYLDGYGTNRIAYTMHEEGYTHREGNWLHPSAVKNVLDNEIYIGMVQFKKELFPGRHEPIIDNDTFEKVRALRKRRSTMNEKVYQKTSLLSGMAFCGNCGARYFKKVSKGDTFYACYSRAKASKHMIKDPNCKNPHWDIDKLNAFVEDELFRLATDKKALDKLLKKKPVPKNDNEVIEKQITDIDKQISKLMDLYQIGTIPVDEISIRIEKLYVEKKTLLSKLVVEDLNEDEFDEKVIREMFNDFPLIWHNATLDVKRRILQGFIKRIVIQKEGENPVIEWSFL